MCVRRLSPVPVYAIKGYGTSFRLAARMDDGLRMFEAYFNPKANEASDVLDIGGKVSGISISHWLPYPATPQVGSIDDPEKIERLVRGLMDAPLKPTSPDHFGSIDFYNVPTNTDDYTGIRDLTTTASTSLSRTGRGRSLTTGWTQAG
jgi:hypothetical protein